MRGKTTVLTVEGAEKIAISALIYVAGDDELCQRFLSLTGMTPQTLRTAAADPGFLSAVLDFVAAHEPTLTAFASHAGIQPGEVDSARHTLGGGNWERETA
ncbi:hypothetical protein GJW-30_1_02748 [Variibacter gotjawalensis]|jgi:hypothetical protein|uniref:DUF3572 domain-containing protein n=1 Tax=Variibacter gotjawalensis TaxID=1333996 RepID=A0A0S3PWF9_9BRAD|nr:DUF3572 domain-containing protein [Variibacter gotjawalensis]NIK46038.1 hypothetical protein [Variibacter gotjawalensis]RZS47956.1 uncharacterized protein DUF3572 [Variibacter gotjawalensis]BAT60212.1 hypothetical protein GJW-30_1_02748 [Variibacter gotjawalensis]